MAADLFGPPYLSLPLLLRTQRGNSSPRARAPKFLSFLFLSLSFLFLPSFHRGKRRKRRRCPYAVRTRPALALARHQNADPPVFNQNAEVFGVCPDFRRLCSVLTRYFDTDADPDAPRHVGIRARSEFWYPSRHDRECNRARPMFPTLLQLGSAPVPSVPARARWHPRFRVSFFLDLESNSECAHPNPSRSEWNRVDFHSGERNTKGVRTITRTSPLFLLLQLGSARPPAPFPPLPEPNASSTLLPHFPNPNCTHPLFFLHHSFFLLLCSLLYTFLRLIQPDWTQPFLGGRKLRSLLPLIHSLSYPTPTLFLHHFFNRFLRASCPIGFVPGSTLFLLIPLGARSPQPTHNTIVETAPSFSFQSANGTTTTIGARPFPPLPDPRASSKLEFAWEVYN
ncbi:hypothetical protein DFH06DRAFT_330846 [Mycena polygramma]|nr:hypothetical protein DFH06DRAFT_330846 [Mycena polygramma]